MSIRQNVWSVLKVIPPLVMILFYGFIASHYSFSRTYAAAQSQSVNALHHFHDQELYDTPERFLVNENTALFLKSKQTREETNHLCLSASVLNQNRFTSYNNYQSQLSVGFERTDIIFPFHYFT
jgi:hypothetical protein